MKDFSKKHLQLLKFKSITIGIGYLFLIALCAKLVLQTSQMQNIQIAYSYLAVIIIFAGLSFIQSGTKKL